MRRVPGSPGATIVFDAWRSAVVSVVVSVLPHLRGGFRAFPALARTVAPTNRKNDKAHTSAINVRALSSLRWAKYVGEVLAFREQANFGCFRTPKLDTRRPNGALDPRLPPRHNPCQNALVAGSQ